MDTSIWSNIQCYKGVQYGKQSDCNPPKTNSEGLDPPHNNSSVSISGRLARVRVRTNSSNLKHSPLF